MTSSLTLSTLALVLVVCTSFNGVTGSAIKAAPYFMPLDNEPQNIDDIVANSGIRHFIFAFALATDQGECLPVWDGHKNQAIADDHVVLEMVKKVRSHGGDISISFGGYNGVDLGHACHSPEALAKAYQVVIDKYQLTHVDFDVEGDDLGPADEESRRFHAIKIIKDHAKAAGKELHITLTMPCTTVGLSDLGKAEIKRGIEVQQNLVDLYKIMAFDYGGPAGSMAESVIGVMEMVHAQLKALRTDLKTDAQVYSHTGMILMNGHTDQGSELFTLDTFSRLVDYAKSKGLGRVSYWALNRDRPCPANRNLGWAAGICSSIAQQPWEFTKIIARFDPSNGSGDNHHVTEPSHHTNAPHTNAPHTNAPHTNAPHTKAPHTPAPHTSAPHVTVDCANAHGEQYFPYEGDCHKYIRCFANAAHIETCSPGTLYDLKLHICNWEANVDRPECK